MSCVSLIKALSLCHLGNTMPGSLLCFVCLSYQSGLFLFCCAFLSIPSFCLCDNLSSPPLSFFLPLSTSYIIFLFLFVSLFFSLLSLSQLIPPFLLDKSHAVKHISPDRDTKPSAEEKKGSTVRDISQWKLATCWPATLRLGASPGPHPFYVWARVRPGLFS